MREITDFSRTIDQNKQIVSLNYLYNQYTFEILNTLRNKKYFLLLLINHFNNVIANIYWYILEQINLKIW